MSSQNITLNHIKGSTVYKVKQTSADAVFYLSELSKTSTTASIAVGLHGSIHSVNQTSAGYPTARL